MANVKFPPDLPVKFGEFVEIEQIDANTIKLKNKKTGQDIGTVTREQLERAIQSIMTAPSKG